MNLLVKKFKVMAVGLLLPLFFASCEDPGKIGINVDPENSIITARYQEFVLPSSQVQFSPRSTVNSNSLQAGTYTDSDFGIVASKSFTWLGVQSSAPKIDANAMYVNTTLSLQFVTFYGSEAENNEIESYEIYQLANPMDASDYTRIDEIALGSLLGTVDILIQSDDTIRVDSVYSIAINDDFGQLLFDKLKAEDPAFENDENLNAFINGIAIIAKTGNNKIVQFNTLNFVFELNYTEENSAGETVEREYQLGLGPKRFYHLDSDVSGTSLAGILPDNKDFTPSSDFRYMQAGTLIALKVDLNPIINFFADQKGSDSINSVIIQKAFLSVGDIAENTPGASVPFSIMGYFTDSENVWPALAEFGADTAMVMLQNEFINATVPVFPGFYGTPQEMFLGLYSDLLYEATMSNFIQNLILGRYNTIKTPYEQQGKMFLFAPTSISVPQSAPSHSQTNFFKVHKDSIKVKIYYSTSNL